MIGFKSLGVCRDVSSDGGSFFDLILFSVLPSSLVDESVDTIARLLTFALSRTLRCLKAAPRLLLIVASVFEFTFAGDNFFESGVVL